MFNLNEILTINAESAYDFAYDLPMNKNYSNPKIYTANGDLKQRWYLYFSFRNTETGKLQRMKNIYGKKTLIKPKKNVFLS